MVKFINIVFMILISCIFSTRLKAERSKHKTKISLPTKIIMNNCNIDTCHNGNCFENICLCKEGYIDISHIVKTELTCNYRPRKHLVAFYLELIFPSIGHLYTHRIIFGVVKLLLFAVFWLMLNFADKVTNKILRFSKIILIIILLFAHWIDCLLFFMNKYIDGYGIQLID